MEKNIKKISIEVPTSWEGITLTQFLNLKKDLELLIDIEDEVKREEEYFKLLLIHICNIDTKFIKHIDSETLIHIKAQLFSFMNETECEIQPIIKINGKEYGFIPNLSKMSYAEYLDLTQYDEITIDENWNKIMSILYRPIVKKKKHFYTIKEYTSEEDYEIFNNVNMEIHYGAMFFFINLSKTLANYILKYLVPQYLEQIKKDKTIMRKNGKDILHSINSLTEKLQILTKY